MRTRHQVQGGNDRGPGVHVRRQEVGPAGQGVDQGGLARLDLAQDGDGGLKGGKVLLQPRQGLRCRLTSDGFQRRKRGIQMLGLLGEFGQRLHPEGQEILRCDDFRVFCLKGLGNEVHAG